MEVDSGVITTAQNSGDATVVGLLSGLVQALVDRPEGVLITAIRAEQTTILEVKVEPDDVRRIIGRKGRTADALREILLNLGGKEGRRYLMEIIEPRGRVTVPVSFR